MCASRIADAIAQPEITTPHATVATKKRRSAADIRTKRGSSGPRLLRVFASPSRSTVVFGQPKCADEKPNTSNFGKPPPAARKLQRPTS